MRAIESGAGSFGAAAADAFPAASPAPASASMRAVMERMPAGYHGIPLRQPGGSPFAFESRRSGATAARDAFRRYVGWLRDDSFPAWRRAGFDAGTGLFFERLTLAGRPDRSAELRLRTHMRQVYCFAHGATLVNDLRKGEKGWAVLADPEGNEFCVLTRQDKPATS